MEQVEAYKVIINQLRELANRALQKGEQDQYFDFLDAAEAMDQWLASGMASPCPVNLHKFGLRSPVEEVVPALPEAEPLAVPRVEEAAAEVAPTAPPAPEVEAVSLRPIYDGTEERVWAAGDRLRGRRGIYKLLAEVGRGKTGQVFRARWEESGEVVAVKIRWPDLSDEERRRFAAEGITLLKLREAEEARQDGLLMAPELHEMWPPLPPGYRVVPDTYYIVEEFVEAEQVRDLVGQLTEEEALLIGWRFCRLLDILHTKLHHTYATVVGSDEGGRPVSVSDMKLQNLWWDRTNRILKVTDWNVLGPEGDLRGEKADVFRFSLYLYQMLVGTGLREQEGMVKTRLDAASGWQKLSLGSQQILQRALHSNPARRYGSAAELEAALCEQWKLWQEKSGLTLVDVAKKQVEEAEAMVIPSDTSEPERISKSRERRGLLEKATNRLQIAASKLEVDEQQRLEMLEQLEELLKREKSLVEAGRDLFVGKSYETAQSLFRQAQEENPWSLEPQRWLVVVQAGLDRQFPDRESRARASKAVERLTTGRYIEAEAELRALKLTTLAMEARLWETFEEAKKAEEAQPPDYNKAREWYATVVETMGTLRQIPYWELLAEEVGDPGARAQEMERLAASIGVARHKLEEGRAAWEKGDLEAAIACYRAGLEAHHGDESLITACVQAGRELLKEGKPGPARRLLELAVEYGRERETAQRLWAVARGALQVQAALEGGARDRALERATWLVRGSGEAELARAVLRPSLETALVADVQAERLTEARHLMEAIEALYAQDEAWKPWIEKVQELEGELKQREQESEEKRERERQAAIQQGLIRVRDFRAQGTLVGLKQALEELREVKSLLRESDPQWANVQQNLEALEDQCRRLEQREATEETRKQWRGELENKRKEVEERLARMAEDADFVAVLKSLEEAREWAGKLEDKTSLAELEKRAEEVRGRRVRWWLSQLAGKLTGAREDADFSAGIEQYRETQKLATEAQDAVLQGEVTKALRQEWRQRVQRWLSRAAMAMDVAKMDDDFERAIRQYKQARKLADEARDAELQQKTASELRAAQRQWIEWQLGKGKRLLGEADEDEKKFDEATDWFTKAGKLAEEIGDIELMAKAERGRAAVDRARVPDTQRAVSKKLTEIDDLLRELARIDDEVENLKVAKFCIDEPKLAMRKQKTLTEALKCCLEALGLHPGHAGVEAQKAKILDRLDPTGEAGWLEVVGFGNERLARVRNKIEEAQIAYVEGEADQAWLALSSIEEKVLAGSLPLHQPLQSRIQRARGFVAVMADSGWETAEPAFETRQLQALEEALEWDLPGIYWKKYGALEYLKRLQQQGLAVLQPRR